MPSDFNRMQMIGTVVTEPEYRLTQAGKEMARFAMTTVENWRDVSGERREKAEFHLVVVLNDHLVKVVRRSVRSGSRVMAEGRFERRTYDDGHDIREVCEMVLGFVRATLLVLDSHADAARLGVTAGNAPVPPPPLTVRMPDW